MKRVFLVILILFAAILLLFVCDELPRWRNREHLRHDLRVFRLDSTQRVALYYRAVPAYPEEMWLYQRDLTKEEIGELLDALLPSRSYLEYGSKCPYYLRFEFVGENHNENIFVGTDDCNSYAFDPANVTLELTRNDFLYNLMASANYFRHGRPPVENSMAEQEPLMGR